MERIQNKITFVDMSKGDIETIKQKAEKEISEIASLQEKLLNLNKKNFDDVNSFIQSSVFIRNKHGLTRLICSIESAYNSRPLITSLLLSLFDEKILKSIKDFFSDEEISHIINNHAILNFFHEKGFTRVPEIESHSQIVDAINNDPFIKSIREDNLSEFQNLIKPNHKLIDQEIKNIVPEEIDFIKIHVLHAYPIEASAYFGSVQIFKYLFHEKVTSLKSPKLKYHAIAGGNMEIINLVSSIEGNKYDGDCLEIAIKFQRNEIIPFLEKQNLKFTIHSLFNCIRNYNLIIFGHIIESILFDASFDMKQINEKEKGESIVQMVSRTGFSEFMGLLVSLKSIDLSSKGEVFCCKLKMEFVK
ncbi:hypothetical protein TRFO_13066 [Tritrichomonas foetus]|uniref:DUF3447 domain-containing protein n=1 Tax=Tritrichomonas foetus TaxID=1144522 RepID=A0A1J4L3W0_9EUKA|nr:hypothetical protein TRFO_13066 [Tritrichomonas foetus]|eukprot:OHT16638.1 hypothetical protein TRFO_13066 [Tritrichomonas foetus]